MSSNVTTVSPEMKQRESMPATGRRRALHFDDFADVIPDVRQLQTGYRAVGQWSLSQTCRHLADSFHASIDGFDLSRHRIKRFLFSKQMLYRALTRGIPEGYTVDEKLTPTGKQQSGPAIDALEAAMDRYRSCDGPLSAHPLFGLMDRDMWDRVHKIHCAHHLSFLWPL